MEKNKKAEQANSHQRHSDFEVMVATSDETVSIEVFNMLCPSPLYLLSSEVSDLEDGKTKSIHLHFGFSGEAKKEGIPTGLKGGNYRVIFDRTHIQKILLSVKKSKTYGFKDVVIWKKP